MFKRMGFKSSIPNQVKKPVGGASFSCKLCKERIVLSQLAEHQKYCPKGDNPLPRQEPQEQAAPPPRKRTIQESESDSESERPRKTVKVANPKPGPKRETKNREDLNLKRQTLKEKESEAKISNSKKANKSASRTQASQEKSSKKKPVLEEGSSDEQSSSSVDSTESSEEGSSEYSGDSDDHTPLANVITPKKAKEVKKGLSVEKCRSVDVVNGGKKGTKASPRRENGNPLVSPKCNFCSKDFETIKSVTSHYPSCKVRRALKAIESQLDSKENEKKSEVKVKEEPSDDVEKSKKPLSKSAAKTKQAKPEKDTGTSSKEEKKATVKVECHEPKGSKKISAHRESPQRATKSFPLKGRTSSSRAAKGRHNGDIYMDDELEKAETTLVIFNRRSLLRRLVATTKQGDPDILLSRTVSV